MTDGQKNTLKLKIKKLHPDAKIPSYAKPGDACVDLTAVSREINAFTGQVIYGIGLAFEIPDNHVMLLFPRSSICKQKLALSNSVGVVDAKFRGEVKAVFNSTGSYVANKDQVYDVGDRVCQAMIIPYPMIEFEEVEELSETERSTGGFGSTGA